MVDRLGMIIRTKSEQNQIDKKQRGDSSICISQIHRP
jgi:hypothetical protein